MSIRPPDPPRGAGRFGPLFAGIWLFFLLDPVLAGVRAEDDVRGAAGVATTVVFAGVYMSLWWRMRLRARSTVGVAGSPSGVPHPGHAPGGVADARETTPVSLRAGALPGTHPGATSFRPGPPSTDFRRHPPGDMGTETPAGAASLLLALTALSALMMVLLGEPGIASAVYIAVAVVMTLPLRLAAPVVVAIAVGTVLLGLLPGWEPELGTAFGVLAASFAVFGLRTVIRRNSELLVAHEANAELAVENERSRFARDLHDILGHSLTVITVKAELAGRLFDADPERARAEIADLERLSRDALADVRRAVEGYRDLTLPGELARARTALAAAQIEAVVPNATDEVPGEVRELFAWTIREAVTNVVRHSGARRCEVRLSPHAVEVRDDGRGVAADATRGSGLTGLQERASALGATLVTRSLDPGWSVAVVLP